MNLTVSEKFKKHKLYTMRYSFTCPSIFHDTIEHNKVWRINRSTVKRNLVRNFIFEKIKNQPNSVYLFSHIGYDIRHCFIINHKIVFWVNLTTNCSQHISHNLFLQTSRFYSIENLKTRYYNCIITIIILLTFDTVHTFFAIVSLEIN